MGAVTEDAPGTLFSLGSYTGREGWKDALLSWRDTWSSVNTEVVRVLNPPGDRVFLEAYAGGCGETSGIPLEEPVFGVLRIKNGMAVEGAVYRDRAVALEAVGLSE
jgi:hypothetical protein